jgi:hypothetical protein
MLFSTFFYVVASGSLLNVSLTFEWSKGKTFYIMKASKQNYCCVVHLFSFLLLLLVALFLREAGTLKLGQSAFLVNFYAAPRCTVINEFS